MNTAFHGPAERAGIRPNDTIISIDGIRNLAERPISEIGALLTGESGTDIELVIKRHIGRADELVETFKLIREVSRAPALQCFVRQTRISFSRVLPLLNVSCSSFRKPMYFRKHAI